MSGRRRALAILALVLGAALVVATLSLLFGHGRFILGVILGMAVAAAGSWWMITRRGMRRGIGAAVAVGGLGLALGAILAAASTPEDLLLHLCALVVLLALTSGAAQLALRRDIRALEQVAAARTRPPRHPVLLCNPWSGDGKVGKFGLVELARSRGVETVLLDHGLDLEQLARDAVARGADCLGMAGGDGSQALVASIAVEHDLPFVCVSAGTRNHFALDLGLDRDDPRRGIEAFGDAVERAVDFATVNGRFFVNNVSLGVYATIVQQDEYREAKVGTTSSLVPELLGRADQPFDLQFTEPDGRTVDGPYLVQVSNNPYVLGPALDLTQRRQLDTGTLGVFAVTGSSGAEAAALTHVGRGRPAPAQPELARVHDRDL